MQSIRLAFMGFRHGHILSLYGLAAKTPGVEIVAACEEDAETRARMAAQGIPIKHDDYRAMLDAVPCDAVAVGDYYGKRGSILVEALRRGKHVIGDKPLCTSLDECETITGLARAHGLAVGCQLDLREHPAIRCLRDAVIGGTVGEVQAVAFTGQHPLMYGSRPDWYFEEGKHGGTINDIAIHAIDALPWMTGRGIARIEAARGWNTHLSQAPWFQNGAQMMLTLDNGAGVLGDVSYFQPDNFAYAVPQYWRFTFWGTDGVLEGGVNAPVVLYGRQRSEPETLPHPATRSGAYFESFLAEIRGAQDEVTLSTTDILTATRTTLAIQEMADRGLRLDVKG